MPNRLYVFGSNGESQLGIPAEEIVNTPTIAQSWPSLNSIETIRGGDNHSLFLTELKEVWGVGDNRKGQLISSNKELSRIEGIKRVCDRASFCAATCESSTYVVNPDTSDEHTQSILLTDGTSHWGELGLGDFTTTLGFGTTMHGQDLPCPVIDFAAGGWHYIAILSDGSIYGWGKSRLDQLGPTLSIQQRISVPTLISEPIPFTPIKVVCGKEFSYIASDPSLGQHYLLGRDKFSLRSSMPPHITNWKTIGATWNSIFVLFQDGRLTAWGKDNMWKLLPEGLPPIEQIAVGSEHVLALTREGKLISWGWGKHGNCGNLENLGDRVKGDMISGFWNEIEIPGKIKHIGAGFCTSFVLTKVEDDGEKQEEQ